MDKMTIEKAREIIKNRKNGHEYSEGFIAGYESREAREIKFCICGCSKESHRGEGSCMECPCMKFEEETK